MARFEKNNVVKITENPAIMEKLRADGFTEIGKDGKAVKGATSDKAKIKQLETENEALKAELKRLNNERGTASTPTN